MSECGQKVIDMLQT